MSENDEVTLPSGLIIPNRVLNEQQRTLTPRTIEIIVPGSREQIKLPETRSLDQLTDDELLEHIPKVTEKHSVNPRNPSELALAIHNPALFLRNEIEKDTSLMGISNVSIVKSLISDVNNSVEYSANDLIATLQREKTQLSLHNEYSTELTRSSPGALESVLIKICSLLNEKQLQNPQIAYYLIVLPSRAFQEIRRMGRTQIDYEMPELAEMMLLGIENFDKYPGIRHAIYDLLSQTKIPDSMIETWLLKMKHFKDLQHPLANKLLYQLYDYDPDNNFLKEQRKLVEELRTDVSIDSQTLFEKYEELSKKLKHIVTTCLPDEIIAGKVGLEVEFKSLLYRTRISASHWSLQLGASSFAEIRLQKNALDRNTSYAERLDQLSDYLRDSATFTGTTHLHYDVQEHPHSPGLMGLLPYSSHRMQGLVRERRFPTWEIRGVKPPVIATSLSLEDSEQHRYLSTIHSARYNELIEFFSRITKTNHDQVKKLHISSSQGITPDQLIFGHIACLYSDPHIRMLALSITNEGQMFSAWNPKAFVETYMSGSLIYIIDSLNQSDLNTDTATSLQSLQTQLESKSSLEKTLVNRLNTLFHAHEYKKFSQIINSLPNEIAFNIFADQPQFSYSGFIQTLDTDIFLYIAQRMIEDEGIYDEVWFLEYVNTLLEKDLQPNISSLELLFSRLAQTREGQQSILKLIKANPLWLNKTMLARTITTINVEHNYDEIGLLSTIIQESDITDPTIISAAKISIVINQEIDNIEELDEFAQWTPDLIHNAHLIKFRNSAKTFVNAISYLTKGDSELSQLAFEKFVDMHNQDPKLMKTAFILKFTNASLNSDQIIAFIDSIQPADNVEEVRKQLERLRYDQAYPINVRLAMNNKLKQLN